MQGVVVLEKLVTFNSRWSMVWFCPSPPELRNAIATAKVRQLGLMALANSEIV